MGWISDLFSDKTKTKTSPWGPAQPYLKDSMEELGGLAPPQFYLGPQDRLTAEQNPMMQEGLAATYGYGAGRGGDLADATGFGGLAGLNAMGGGMNYLNQMAGQGPNTFGYDQGLFDTTMANLTPGLQGQYNALMRDPIRQYQEQIIPGINAGAAGAGQSFGTRPFNTGAIAARGLADRGADTMANLWTNAATQAQQAAMFGGAQNLASANLADRNILGGYQGYANMANPMLRSSYDMSQQNLGNMLQAGQYQQLYNQSVIDRDIQRDQYNQESAWNYNLDRLRALQGVPGGITQGSERTGLGNAALQLGGAYLMGG